MPNPSRGLTSIAIRDSLLSQTEVEPGPRVLVGAQTRASGLDVPQNIVGVEP